MVVLKPEQAEEWIVFAQAAGQPLVIIVGQRIEAYAIEPSTSETVAALLRES